MEGNDLYLVEENTLLVESNVLQWPFTTCSGGWLNNAPTNLSTANLGSLEPPQLGWAFRQTSETGETVSRHTFINVHVAYIVIILVFFFATVNTVGIVSICVSE